MNLLQPIFSSLVNKIFHYIVMLFLCYVFPFASKDFVFPLLHWSIRGFKLERIYKKKSQRFFILCRMEKLDLLWGTNVLLFDVLTISIGHFVLFFSILSQKKKKKFYLKKKNNTQSSCLIFFFIFYVLIFFFIFYVGWTYILLEGLIIYQNGIAMNISNMWSVTVLSNL